MLIVRCFICYIEFILIVEYDVYRCVYVDYDFFDVFY